MHLNDQKTTSGGLHHLDETLRHYADWFPALRRVDRTSFARQAANLWAVKQRLWQAVSQQVVQSACLSLIDSFPLPVCRFGRAIYCRRFRGMATYGYDEVAKQKYYGLRAHVRGAWPS